jgi:asparagine N-glycosylation enzyme membrane subunit Stt3
LAPAFSILAAVGTIGVLKPFITLLKEPSKIVSKKKFGLEHVGKEFSGTAVFMVFLILMTNFAISPQSGGIPKVLSQAYAPMTITAGSLPISTQEPVREWMDMLVWTRSNLNSGTVVCAWWDYGYWLTLLGNVTTLADNATINSTQIENIGFIFMANETKSLEMLKRYNAEYILVFTTLGLSQSQSGVAVTEARYGDEGKWMWMAKISGQAHDRFVSSNFTDENSAWTDETKFGSFNQSTWIWSDAGTNSTIYALMSWARHKWTSEWASQYGLTEPEPYVEPQYFKEAYIAGLSLSPQDAQKYGGIIPLVCLYEIEYPTE